MTDDSIRAATAETSADGTTTGDPRVDAATSGLGELDALPVGDHVERYADVHSRLQDILNEVDTPASPVD